MKTVYKYRFADANRMVAPQGTVRLVACQQYDDKPTLWIEHEKDHAFDRNESFKMDAYALFGTGHLIPDDAEFVGSAQCGQFVWHVYRMPGR